MGKKARPKDTDFVFTSFQPSNEVTGSAFLLEIPQEGVRMLLDCGAYQKIDSRRPSHKPHGRKNYPKRLVKRA